MPNIRNSHSGRFVIHSATCSRGCTPLAISAFATRFVSASNSA